MEFPEEPARVLQFQMICVISRINVEAKGVEDARGKRFRRGFEELHLERYASGSGLKAWTAAKTGLGPRVFPDHSHVVRPAGAAKTCVDILSGNVAGPAPKGGRLGVRI